MSMVSAASKLSRDTVLMSRLSSSNCATCRGANPPYKFPAPRKPNPFHGLFFQFPVFKLSDKIGGVRAQYRFIAGWQRLRQLRLLKNTVFQQ
jgi:hypothetical protein